MDANECQYAYLYRIICRIDIASDFVYEYNNNSVQRKSSACMWA